VYPNVLVAPYLTITGTDARHYARIADAYRFLPIHQRDALASIHGTNEHVGIDAYENAIRTYATILRSME
jgi:carboxypeptidase PM20D1